MCDRVVWDKVVCDKVVCDNLYVLTMVEDAEEGEAGEEPGLQIQNQEPHTILWGKLSSFIILEGLLKKTQSSKPISFIRVPPTDSKSAGSPTKSPVVQNPFPQRHSATTKIPNAAT